MRGKPFPVVEKEKIVKREISREGGCWKKTTPNDEWDNRDIIDRSRITGVLMRGQRNPTELSVCKTFSRESW